MAKAKGKLTKKQKVFAEEYQKDLNAAKAAERAGYSPDSAMNQGPRMTKMPHVREEIQKKLDERSERTKIDADYVLHTIKDTVERCRQAEPVIEWDPIEKTMVPTGEWKFDANAVLKGCDLLGKHLKLWTDQPKVDVSLNLTTLSDDQLEERIKELESKLK